MSLPRLQSTKQRDLATEFHRGTRLGQANQTRYLRWRKESESLLDYAKEMMRVIHMLERKLQEMEWALKTKA